MADQRPDPDQLLDKIQRETEKCRRGRLKVFFGACAGVGKTYAMLSAARALRQQGADVVVGVAETHGRSETAVLLEGLEVLPPQSIQYRGRTLREFDLDGALRRKPAVLLLDELAHSNVLGSRHPKRWQDAEELLSAGIDVYTTVNVQHLEGLNDIVGQITGIRVRETLPDTVFELADEVALVDLPPDELLQRLKEGKVYLPRQAEHAAENFFRKGNLIALRELALRRTADRVDAQMREYRTDRAIQGVWKAKERLLACVGPGLGAESLVRSASCLAADLRADWRAVYVETPGLQRLSASARGQVLKSLRLAQELGAETETLAGTDLAQVLLDYARTHNISKILVGKSRRSALSRRLTPSVSERLASRSTDIDVHVVGQGKEDLSRPQAPARLVEYVGAPDLRYRRYVWTALICAATTLVGAKLLWFFDLANIVMLYLLSVVLVAIRYGRGPGVFASFLGVAAFDFFLVPPKHSLTVADTQYLLTFAVLLSVALIISHLTANLRYQARIAQFRERRARALYEMGRELAAALTMPQIAEIAARHLYAVFQVKVALLLPDGQDKVAVTALPHDVPDASPEIDLGIAQWAYDRQEPAGMGTNTLPGSPVHYLPLKAPMRTRGVAAVVPGSPRQIFLPEQQRLLDTFAAQIGLALERVHYVEVAQAALLHMESERLRNSLLSAISHDLRTPLTAIVGLASTLSLDRDVGEDARRDALTAIQEEALRMGGLVNNLLDMARLTAGGLKLNMQWQMVEEVVGSALRAEERPLSKHHVQLDLAPGLPLTYFDAVLIERVLCNLLENAAKYTPVGSTVEVGARVQGKELRVFVADDGPGLPAGMEERIFEKFTRGRTESSTPGVGLGLAICRAIVEAHGGKIWAETRREGGAKFTFSLPLTEAPEVTEAPEPDLASEVDPAA
jgi:two-component system sensor histidine kinase KdpD